MDKYDNKMVAENMKKNVVKMNENTLKQIIAKSVKKALKESDGTTIVSMGTGEQSVDASYYRINKALEALDRIADTMSENNYYETEESALRSQISYIRQEIDYLKNKNVLKETELDYDIDNFSGRWNRGPRYDIYIGDTLMYKNVSDEAADRLWDGVCRKAEMWGEEPRCVEV